MSAHRPEPLTETFMARALEAARHAATMGEIPVGAVLVDASRGAVVALAHNEVEAGADPTAHAEVLVIRRGARALGAKRLESCDLYVTLEPCAMCAAAISLARIRRLYFGAYDPKGGAVDHGPRFFAQPTCHHRPEVFGGLNERACEAVLKGFFDTLRRDGGSRSRG